MSKARVCTGQAGDGSTSAPYNVRREKSRQLAQKRRDHYKEIMEDLTNVLPFPREAVSQLDYNSRLRLALCFFRLKTMVEGSSGETAAGGEGASELQQTTDSGKQMAIVKRKIASDTKPVLFQPGMLQDLMSEALDGFLMVTQVDGTIVFLSESIHRHMGLFQSEHIGVNMFELIHEEDHADVRKKVEEAEMRSLNQKGAAKVTFFCRMKCSRYKLANVISKSPNHKLVYVTGTIKRARGEPFIACVVRPVSPPSVLEIRLEGNMFVCRYGVDFTCTYFDGRLRPLLGYDKDDLIGKQPFDLFHHDDIAAIVKCRNKVFEKGESLSGYYRFFNAHGESIWLQTRATLIIDSRTGKPVCVNCMFFVISKEDGDKDLQSRLAIKAAESNIKEESIHSHDPIPVVERSDGTVVNPLHDDDELSNLSSPPTTSEPSPSSTTDLVSSGSGKESPTSSSSLSVSGTAEAQSSVSLNGAAYSPPGSDSSPVMISSSGLGLSTSDLHSISSVGSGGSAASSGTQSYQHHVLNQHHGGSSTSISSGGISSRDSVFTDRSSPQEPVSTTVSQRSKSTSPDGSCVPDSTTIHSTSSPLSVQLTGKMARTDSADLGYRSGSNSSLSLRDRLMSGYSGASPMTRTDSNASSIVSNNPLSASSSVGSLQLHGSVASGTGSEFSSHSTFQQGGNGLDFMSAAANPTFAPLAAPTAADQYNNGNIQYVQQQHQPIGVATTATNNASFPLMHQQQMGGMQFVTSTQFGGAGQMTTMHSMGNGAPQQQFMQQSNLPMNGIGGVDPNNINSLPDWTPAAPAVSDFNTTTSSASASTFLSSAGGISGVPPQQQGVNPMFGLQTTGGPGFEYIAPSVPGNGIPQQEMYNPPPITVAGSDMYNGSTAGHLSSSTTTPFQQALPAKNVQPTFTACNGNHSTTMATSDLPLLTGEDLKILEAFDPVGATGGSQFNGQMMQQQTAANGHAAAW